MTRFLLCLLVLLGALSRGAAAAEPLSADDRTLRPSWSVLADPQETLQIQDLQRPEVAARFEPRQGAAKLGFRTGAVWLRLQVDWPASAQAYAPWWLEFQSALLNEVVVYTPTPQGGWTAHAAGNRIPWLGRDLAYRTPVFLLEPDAGSGGASTVLYARLRSHSTMSFGLALHSNASFVSATALEHLIFGIFLAVNLTLVLTNLWFFQATREASYGLFSLFTLINVVNTGFAEGFLYQYVLSEHPALNEWLGIICYWMSVPVGLLFVVQYLQLFATPQPSWVRPVIRLYTGVSVLALLLLWHEPPWLRPAFGMWVVVAVVFGSLLVLLERQRGNPGARLLLWSMLPYWLAVVLRMGRNLGWFEASLLTDYAYYVAMLVYLLALNYAVSRRYRDLWQSKRRAEKALEEGRQAQLLQQQFLNTMSHELRTPLAVIEAAAHNLALDKNAAPPEVQNRYDKILRATDRMASLLEGYLDGDRLELLYQEVRRESVRPAELLEDVRRAAAALSDRHLLQVDTLGLPPTFDCDPRLTLLALRTLADNAVKYTPPGTTVWLRGRCAHDGVQFEVQDSGPGIAAQDVDQLFERFFRGHATQGIPGSGLGLHLARQLTMRQGGTLTLQSSPGQGAHFVIWLPRRLAPI